MNLADYNHSGFSRHEKNSKSMYLRKILMMKNHKNFRQAETSLCLDGARNVSIEVLYWCRVCPLQSREKDG